MRDNGLSVELTKLFAHLSPKERDILIELLRDPHIYIAEDVRDLVAILREIKD